MPEELVKTLLENPEMALTGGSIAYGALSYAAGKSRSFATEKEAELALDKSSYDSLGDVLKGLYNKGIEHAAKDEIELRRSEAEEYINEIENEGEFSSWEDAASEIELRYGD